MQVVTRRPLTDLRDRTAGREARPPSPLLPGLLPGLLASTPLGSVCLAEPSLASGLPPGAPRPGLPSPPAVPSPAQDGGGRKSSSCPEAALLPEGVYGSERAGGWGKASGSPPQQVPDDAGLPGALLLGTSQEGPLLSRLNGVRHIPKCPNLSRGQVCYADAAQCLPGGCVKGKVGFTLLC